MNKHVYKRYFITCGNQYFVGLYKYQGDYFAAWDCDERNAKEYRKITAVNAMKERLEKNGMIQGDHEGRTIEIETVERKFY